MHPMSRKPIPVKVEYTDRNGNRVTKEFTNLPQAKAFAIRNQDKDPKFVAVVTRNK